MAEPTGEAARYIPAARAGSREALGQMLEACRGYLLMIAREEFAADLQGKAGASDLLQETFIDAYRDFAQFQGNTEAELLGWLRRLLLNNMANFARRYRATAKRRAASEIPLEGDSSSADWAGGLIGDFSTPSEHVMAQEQAQTVQRALARLPADYRQVLLLRYQEELPFEEIGRLMNRSANAAEKLWARAIARLQQELEPPP